MIERLTAQDHIILENLNDGMWLMLKKGTETIVSSSGATVTILKSGTIERLEKIGLVKKTMRWKQKVNFRYTLTDEGMKYKKEKY